MPQIPLSHQQEAGASAKLVPVPITSRFTCKPAENFFAFPRLELVRQPRLYISVDISAFLYNNNNNNGRLCV